MSEDEMITQLRTYGIVETNRRFPISAFREFMNTRPVYQDHVRQGKAQQGPLGSYPWMCHEPHDSIRAPGLLETAIDALPIARRFLGTQRALIFSLNTFYTEPNITNPRPDIQGWHRDADDPAGFLAMFIYGTDVKDDDDGPHQYQMGTHTNNALAGPYPVGTVRTIYGPAGSIFFSASQGIHQGLVPKRARRMLIWARFCVSDPPPAYQWDGLTPLNKDELGDRYPTNPEIQDAIHLVVK